MLSQLMCSSEGKDAIQGGSQLLLAIILQTWTGAWGQCMATFTPTAAPPARRIAQPPCSIHRRTSCRQLRASVHTPPDAAPQVLPCSSARVWWKCAKDASHPPWHCPVAQRTAKGSSCPICASDSRRRQRTHPRLLEGRPELAQQWHPTKNGDLGPEHVRLGSNKIVWWLCEKSTCQHTHVCGPSCHQLRSVWICVAMRGWKW